MVATTLGCSESAIHNIKSMTDMLSESLLCGGKIMVCGCGGSAADAQHFVGELVGRFNNKRGGLAAMSLATDPSVVTSIVNDFGASFIFARQVEALGMPQDVLIGITTSGISASVWEAIKVAKEKDIETILLVGSKHLDDIYEANPIVYLPDIVFAVPQEETPYVQLCHSIILHTVAERLDVPRNE